MMKSAQKMFNIIPPDTQFDFVGRRYIWLGVSLLAVLGSIILMMTKGLNYGIDFDGGAEVQVKLPVSWQIGQVRSVIEESGLKNARIQQIGESSDGEYLIRAKGDDEASLATVAGSVKSAFSKTMTEGKDFFIEKSDIVGAAAGSILRKQGALAMFYALLVILVYVGVRFDSRYAPGAVIALFHDSVIVLGVFVLTQKQFDLTILAAILALIGYSNNDTIIVFDRVRETLQLFPSLKISEAVNRAVNETVGRTIITSFTTFLVVVALFFLGGSVIENFAFTLMVGIVVGTYSSIFIASSLLIELTNYSDGKKGKQQKSTKKKKSYQVRPDPSYGA